MSFTPAYLNERDESFYKTLVKLLIAERNKTNYTFIKSDIEDSYRIDIVNDDNGQIFGIVESVSDFKQLSDIGLRKGNIFQLTNVNNYFEYNTEDAIELLSKQNDTTFYVENRQGETIGEFEIHTVRMLKYEMIRVIINYSGIEVRAIANL